jgi:DNA-binding Lrp family transcriptional regulator
MGENGSVIERPILMKTIKLTDRQRLILRVAEFHYQEGVQKIAAICGLKPQAVRYELHQLEELKVIVPLRFTNEASLGYYLFHVHLSVRPGHVDKLVTVLKENSRVGFLGVNGGERSLGVTFLSRRPEDLFTSMDAAGARAKVPFSQVAWSIEGELYHFGAKFLWPEAIPGAHVIQSWGRPRVEIDAVDARILQLLKRGLSQNTALIAKRLGLPASTVQYRLKGLEKNGVILPMSAGINAALLGYSEFEVLLRTSLVNPAEHQRLVKFCQDHPAIRILIRSFGDWEYKFTAQLERTADIFALEDEVHRLFPATVQSTTIVPRRKIIKFGDFPVEDFEEARAGKRGG